MIVSNVFMTEPDTAEYLTRSTDVNMLYLLYLMHTTVIVTAVVNLMIYR